MKKIISLALSLSMLACMASTAFAATDHVVGTRGVHQDGTAADSISDGAKESEFTSEEDSATTIDIQVSTGSVQHRYAVDVEYTNVVLSMNGNARVWDVNQLKYVYTQEDTGLNNNGDWNPTFVVKNYSDQDVYVQATVARTNENDGLNITTSGITKGTDGITDDVTSTGGWNKLSSAAPTGNATDGEVKSLGFKLSVALVEGKTWNDVANTYADAIVTGNGTATVATFTVKVAKNAPTPTP